MCLWTLELQGDRNMARNKARWWQHSQKVTPHLQACFCLTAPLRNIVPPFYFISFTNGKKKKKKYLCAMNHWWMAHIRLLLVVVTHVVPFLVPGPRTFISSNEDRFLTLWHSHFKTPITSDPPHTHTSQFNWRNTVLLEPRHVSCALLETFLSTFF